MNILSKLFGSKSTSMNAATQPVDVSTQEEIPSNLFQELFTDNQAPVINSPALKQSSRLQEFLRMNYTTLGFGDGYDHHSTELLDNKIAIFKSEFRQIIAESIDSRKQEIFQLRNQLIETRGLSERLVEQVELRISELKEVVTQLEKEKELSVDDEGLVMKSIHQYREGFLRGCKDWHETKLFAQSTGLF